MDDEFADPLDDDYDSEIEYDDEFDDEINIDKGVNFKNDFEPLKFGLK
jgi:hypothetical protein